MEEIITNAESLTSFSFKCEECSHEFTPEELQEAIEELCGEPFNGIVLECSGQNHEGEKCDMEYSLDMFIKINSI